MKASNLIEMLQRRIDLYGDWNVQFREFGEDSDLDVNSVYADDEAERIIISDCYDSFGE